MWHSLLYLWGWAFVVCTSHFSLKFLLDQHLSTKQEHYRARKLRGFDFKVEYKPGNTNVVINSLSHNDMEAMVEIAAILSPASALLRTCASHKLTSQLWWRCMLKSHQAHVVRSGWGGAGGSVTFQDCHPAFEPSSQPLTAQGMKASKRPYIGYEKTFTTK